MARSSVGTKSKALSGEKRVGVLCDRARRGSQLAKTWSIWRRRSGPKTGRIARINWTASTPLICVMYGGLYSTFRAGTGLTARSRSSAARATTSRSVMQMRAMGEFGFEGGPLRNVPSPSSTPASQ